MSNALKHLLMADAPAARDANFEIAVLARIEQRRFRRGLAGQAALAVMAALVLALVMPGLQPLWDAGLAAGHQVLPRIGLTNLGLGIVLMAVTLGLQVGFPLSRE